MALFLLLPLEIRLTIYGFVLKTAGNITLRLTDEYGSEECCYECEGIHEPSWNVHRPPKWDIARWEFGHPLFSVSKQIRREAVLQYPVRLTISRLARCKLKNNGNNSFELHSFITCDHDNPNIIPDETLQAGVGSDDYRSLLSDFMRCSIKRVHLDSLYGLDGRYFNKEQFSNLNLASIEALIEKPINYSDEDIFEVQMKSWLKYFLQKDEHPWEIKAGKYDRAFIAEATRMADELTIRNMPDFEARGFAIQIQAQVCVYAGLNQRGRSYDNACEMVGVRSCVCSCT